MSSWHSPQSIFNIGHKAVRDLFDHEVQIQEKIDGSFFAFGRYPEEEMPLKIRSKGAIMVPEAPMAMFKRATATVISLQDKLREGWMYRGECLDKPKHNALAYDRVPTGNIILFDVLTGEEDYLDYEQLKAEAERLGLEVVPQLYKGRIGSAEELRKFLDTTSILGGQKIEGVVIKPLVPVFGTDKKALFAKFVSEAFKEVHKLAWGESNPSTGDIIEKIVAAYATPARWNKSIQHLREAGAIEDSPRDIGPILKEISIDVLKECQDEMKEALFKYAWKHIARGLTRGFPQWYKEKLLELQFEREAQAGQLENGGGAQDAQFNSGSDLDTSASLGGEI